MASSHSLPYSFVTLVFDKRYDEADEILRVQRETMPPRAIPRLAGVEAALESKVRLLGHGIGAQRRILAGTDMVAFRLREHGYWNEAETIYLKVVELSLAMEEAFFLNDARLSRALCLEALGRTQEYEDAKAQVPAGTTILIDGVDWRAEDL
jgi:hypothetical protein